MNYANAALAAGFAVVCGCAHAAEAFPTRPVRMIVAFTAGSETDFFARIVGQKMAEKWAQQVVVDNRPGAGGVLATKLVAAASPDGYTIYMNSMAHAITPAIYTNLPYDTLRDLTGISQVSGVPNVLVVPPGQGVKSVKELIALAKQKPGQLTFGSAGVGSGMHINGEQFRLAADISVVHVAYKGGPEALTDSLAGRINFVFSPIGVGLPLIRDKRLLALGVSTATRSPALPDVPTIAEAGVPGFEFDTWYGLFAPAPTPRQIIRQISMEVARILALPDVKERFDLRGAVARPSTPEEFNKFVRAEFDKLGKIVKAAGLKAE
ncbi:MAG: tripartite tricarboxylate transporter substrate binding protein [Burkholderiales bacterium]